MVMGLCAVAAAFCAEAPNGATQHRRAAAMQRLGTGPTVPLSNFSLNWGLPSRGLRTTVSVNALLSIRTMSCKCVLDSMPWSLKLGGQYAKAEQAAMISFSAQVVSRAVRKGALTHIVISKENKKIAQRLSIFASLRLVREKNERCIRNSD